MKPLQIYLDSSDFSNLSSPNCESNLLRIEEQLIKWQNAGLIEMRFSYVHIIEASPTRREDIDVAAARLQKIRELCGTKCFISTLSIIDQEVNTTSPSISTHKNDYPYRNDGDWLPEVDLLHLCDLSPLTILREELSKTTLDRTLRRKLERQWFDKDGKPKGQGKEKLKAMAPEIAKELEEKFPLSKTVAQKISELMATGNYGKDLQSLLRGSLIDISNWANWCRKYWKEASSITNTLHNTAKEVMSCFACVPDQLNILVDEGETNGLSKFKLSQAIDTEFKRTSTQITNQFATQLGNAAGIHAAKLSVEDSWAHRPGLTSALTVQCYIARRAIQLANGRKMTQSDFGDALHCLHLPFVDVFRADGFTASIINEAKLPFQTKVVPKLSQLVTAIEKVLEHRAKSPTSF